MSVLRLFASLVFLIAACKPQPPGGDDDVTPPDATDAPVDTANPDGPEPPLVRPPGRAVEVVSAGARLSATAGTSTLTFDVVVGGAPRGRSGDGTRTLDAAPVLR